ncbi:DUF4928 family protein [Nocardia sp. NPDC003726]
MVTANGHEGAPQIMSAANTMCEAIRPWYEAKRRTNGVVSSVVMCTGLYITEFLAESFPLIPDIYISNSQVRGASGMKVRAILADHGETRKFSNEGGRTSRGAANLALSLVDVINSEGSAIGVDSYNPSQRRALAWLLQDWFVDRIREDGLRLVEILEDNEKSDVINAVARLYGGKITQSDLDLIADRKGQLDHFEKLLTDDTFFCAEMRAQSKKPEALWQQFFETNPWIFGYGLTLIACEHYDRHKLEMPTTGANVFDGAGKRVDALLRTRGHLSSLVFCEIKRHDTMLLEPNPYRPPDVYRPDEELVGAVCQVQKTADKAVRSIRDHIHRAFLRDGVPAGFEIATIRPRQVVVAGMAAQFQTEAGLNREQVSSFELYRRSVSDVEIITFDELLARAKFIVGDE